LKKKRKEGVYEENLRATIQKKRGNKKKTRRVKESVRTFGGKRGVKEILHAQFRKRVQHKEKREGKRATGATQLAFRERKKKRKKRGPLFSRTHHWGRKGTS